MNDSTSTQLRAIEGEIAKFEESGLTLPYARALLTIAKELETEIEGMDTCILVLEKDRDMQKQFYENTRAHYDSLRSENATLKRQLDEEVKEREDFESRLGEIERSHECQGDGCAVCYALTRDPITRITEIDKL